MPGHPLGPSVIEAPHAKCDNLHVRSPVMEETQKGWRLEVLKKGVMQGQAMRSCVFVVRRVKVSATALTTGLFLTHIARDANCSDCRVSSTCSCTPATFTNRVVLAFPPKDSCICKHSKQQARCVPDFMGCDSRFGMRYPRNTHYHIRHYQAN